MTDAELLDLMQQIRARNNEAWMDILRLALELDAERTRAIFRRIERGDAEVVGIFKEMAR